MTERIKLKRGLAHISPLFNRETRPFPGKRIEPEADFSGAKLASPAQIYYICSLDDETDNHFLNNFFASKLVSQEASGCLVTFDDREKSSVRTVRSEAWNQFLQRISLPAACLHEAFSYDAWQVNETASPNQPKHVFIEMKMNLLLCHPELVQLLDHLVLFVRPQVDSVTETYRKLKQLAAFKLRADAAVVFDADCAGGLPSKIYELFSEFVSRRLSLSMNYWGTLHLSRGELGLVQDLRWDTPGRAAALVKPTSIEKLRFLSWIEKLQMSGASR